MIPVHDITVQHRLLLREIEPVLREVLLEGQSDVVPQVTGLEQEARGEVELEEL